MRREDIEKLREQSRRAYLAKRAAQQAQLKMEEIQDRQLLAQNTDISARERREIEIDTKILNISNSLDRTHFQAEYQLENLKEEGNNITERLKSISKMYKAQEAANPFLQKYETWEDERIKNAGIVAGKHIVFEKPEDEVRLKAIQEQRQQEELRQKRLSTIQESLPVFKYKDDILAAVNAHQVLIIRGETGSGKTTQIPQYLLERSDHECVVCTQPRRVAAMSVAARVASERSCELGSEVGYSVRFDNKTTDSTKILYMTDGHLLREFLLDPLLSRYTTVMIDEAHERAIPTDLLLSLLKDLILVRPELRLIICSATLESKKMSHFFRDCPVFDIPGRRFKVNIKYLEAANSDYESVAIHTIMALHKKVPVTQPCDFLVFLTGQDEIDRMVDTLNHAKLTNAPPLCAYPLYAALPSEKQSLVFRPAPTGTRKIVIATNIAETSITIDSIRYVIDCGYSKQKGYDAKTGCESLEIVPISVSSAEQRAGRAGRTADGECYRLYTKAAFEQEMKKTTPPELLRCNFTPTLLLLLSIGLQSIMDFSFIDPPPFQNVTSAYEALYAMSAINADSRLTELGAQIIQLPISPPCGRALLEAFPLKCVDSVSTICALLEAGSPVFYPPKKNAVENASEMGLGDSEATIRGFWDPVSGDHITLLNVYHAWESADSSRQWCLENHVQYRTLIKARDIKQQLIDICTKMGLDTETPNSDSENPDNNDSNQNSEAYDKIENISKAFAVGFFQNAAQLSKSGVYRTVKGQVDVEMHPSSCLNKDLAPQTVVFYEMVMTTKRYMRTVIKVEPNWLYEAVPHYFKMKHGDNTLYVNN